VDGEEDAAPAEDAPKLWTKKVKKKAEKGEKKPKKGSTVRVNYTGKFDDSKGKQFDSSFNKKKNEHRPLEFKVGTGRVILGWDEALLTMQTGEKAEITIQPEAAYGKKVREPATVSNIILAGLTCVSNGRGFPTLTFPRIKCSGLRWSWWDSQSDRDAVSDAVSIPFPHPGPPVTRTISAKRPAAF